MNTIMRKLNYTAPSAAFFRENRTRVIQRLLGTGVIPADSFILLRGPFEQSIYDDDMKFDVAPEYTFYFITGIVKPDCYGLIDVQNNYLTIFMNIPDPLKSYWEKEETAESYLASGKFDEVLEMKTMKETLINRVKGKKLFLCTGTNYYSQRKTVDVLEELKEDLGSLEVDSHTIFQHVCEERIQKSPEEIRLIKQSVDLGIAGVIEAMKSAKEGLSEVQIANVFEFVLKYYINADFAFETVIATGENAQYSAHTPSSFNLLKNGQLVIINAGARLFNYSSDIARTFAVNKKFSLRQKEIYDIVLKVQESLLQNFGPGQYWKDIQLLAEKGILSGLLELGIVRGDLTELLKKRLAYFFYPYSVGEYIGLYRHDLPGLLNLEVDEEPLELCNMKIFRKLEKDMVVTCGIGIYFNTILLEKCFQDLELSKYVDREKLEKYMPEVQGVFLRDQLVITLEGCEVLSDRLPRKLEEVELISEALRRSSSENKSIFK